MVKKYNHSPIQLRVLKSNDIKDALHFWIMAHNIVFIY